MDRTGRVSHRQQELPGTRQSPEEVRAHLRRGFQPGFEDLPSFVV